ncbi:Thermopsin precursor [Conexivisphaera calida]|uniref:Thermopsin n=1 Tax=Conexivisphaera calida TaxID=1874277 RepID=A0A4P2VKK5_9ARCH|nr:Thermopsin precursor [Conexivisphaera calida]
MAALVFAVALSALPVISAGHHMAIPSVGSSSSMGAMTLVRGAGADPSGSTTLSPGQYFSQQITVYTGMNVTFDVSSSVPVDVYLMTSYQFSEFESTGSSSSVYSAEGTQVSGDVGPLYGGTYYLVVNDDVSSQEASVSYEISTVPVDVYEYHSSLPAPIGIADYGVLNSSGVLHPYRIIYEEAIGTATIYSLGAYNPSPPSGISPYGASLQLNVVLQVNTTSGDFVYWLQDVPGFWTNNETMYVSDNIWNMTSSPSYMANGTVTGNGAVYTWGNGEYYEYSTNTFTYSYPLGIRLAIAYSYSSSGVIVRFGYQVGGGQLVWYDAATIHEQGVTSAYLLVDGYGMTPSGNYYDAELVFGGEGNGEQTHFTRMNSTLLMEYVLPNGSVVYPPALYGFGSNTAETADDLSAVLANGYPAVVVGSGNFAPLWYSVSAPSFSAAMAVRPGEVDAGMEIPVQFASSISNGVAPYTYYFYLNGSLAYNITTYHTQYNGTVYLPPAAAGRYVLQVEVVDAVENEANSSAYVEVNPVPTVHISASSGVTDVGVPVSFSSSIHGGTPPYTYTWYLDGQPVGSSGNYTLTPASPGAYSLRVVVLDSAGYSVSSNVINISVNPDPIVSMYLSTNVTDVGIPVQLGALVRGGTPPYTYTWYLDGQPVGSSGNYTLNPTSQGTYYPYVVVTDSVGYNVSTSPAPITVNPDPTVSISVNASSNNFLYSNDIAAASSSVRGGTPPYTYVWYLNGVPIANTTSPQYTYVLTTMGRNVLQLKVEDSAGYVAQSSEVTVDFTYNYLNIGLIAAIIAAAAAIAAVAIGRRRAHA